MIRKLLFALAILVILVVPASPAHAYCVWTFHQDQSPTYDCYPDYYTELASEPDWCLYTPGDRVAIHYGTPNPYLNAIGWYVIPGSDGTSSLPAGWTWDYYVASHTYGCYIFSAP